MPSKQYSQSVLSEVQRSWSVNVYGKALLAKVTSDHVIPKSVKAADASVYFSVTFDDERFLWKVF